MALVVGLEAQALEKDVEHRPARCTYSIVRDAMDGSLLLQLDTYGSRERKIKNKKSQSIRFTADALDQLVQVLRQNKLGGL